MWEWHTQLASSEDVRSWRNAVVQLTHAFRITAAVSKKWPPRPTAGRSETERITTSPQQPDRYNNGPSYVNFETNEETN